MTSEQIAAFSVANDLYLWCGVIFGLILSGFFKTLLNFIANRFERPRRIKFRHLQGREERKDNVEYLYLYMGEYYTLEQRDFLHKERLKNLKAITRFDFKFFLMFALVIALLISFFISNFTLGI